MVLSSERIQILVTVIIHVFQVILSLIHKAIHSVSTTKQNAKKDPTRRPKNLPHLNFEDERCKHSTFAKEQSLEIR